jgi:DNA-binding transcriptional LysR family regulator
MSLTGPESYMASARLGLGLVQMPNFHAVEDLDRGTLVRVLPELPPPTVPVSLLYPPNRQLSPRVRIFMDWAAREFEQRNLPV